jgi:hypothetical protein
VKPISKKEKIYTEILEYNYFLEYLTLTKRKLQLMSSGSLAQLCSTVILALRRLRREDPVLEASLGYIGTLLSQ